MAVNGCRPPSWFKIRVKVPEVAELEGGLELLSYVNVEKVSITLPTAQLKVLAKTEC